MARTQLKGFIPHVECISVHEKMETCKKSVQSKYEDLCKLRPPMREEVQRMDRVQQVTDDIEALLQQAMLFRRKTLILSPHSLTQELCCASDKTHPFLGTVSQNRRSPYAVITLTSIQDTVHSQQFPDTVCH